MDYIKKSCVFYESIQDMGSHIDTCTFNADIGVTEISRCVDCPYYINRLGVKNYLRRTFREKYGIFIDDKPFNGCEEDWD